MLHNGVIASYPVLVFPVSEWCLEDGILVTMICKHNVLVATPGPDCKAATITSIQLTDWLIPNMHLFCFDEGWNILHLLFFWCQLEDYLFYLSRWGSLLIG